MEVVALTSLIVDIFIIKVSITGVLPIFLSIKPPVVVADGVVIVATFGLLRRRL